MKRFLPVIAAGLLVAGVALAGSIKNWSNGETIRATDLNGNFNHIHNTMVGGHGARLVDADVSPSASIAHTKLATPSLVPKAWALVSTVCTASPCTIAAGSGITSITRSSTGFYVATFTSARANATYSVLISVHSASGDINCSVPIAGPTTTFFNINCRDVNASPATDADSNFSVLVMDDN